MPICRLQKNHALSRRGLPPSLPPPIHPTAAFASSIPNPPNDASKAKQRKVYTPERRALYYPSHSPLRTVAVGRRRRRPPILALFRFALRFLFLSLSVISFPFPFLFSSPRSIHPSIHPLPPFFLSFSLACSPLCSHSRFPSKATSSSSSSPLPRTIPLRPTGRVPLTLTHMRANEID